LEERGQDLQTVFAVGGGILGFAILFLLVRGIMKERGTKEESQEDLSACNITISRYL